MYHIQHAQVSFREMSFSAVWRAIANFFHKIILAIQESKTKEAKRLLAQYQNDNPQKFRG